MEELAKMSGIEVAPCPFCTSIDLRVLPAVSRERFHVECNYCHATGPFYCKSELEALVRWNAWQQEAEGLQRAENQNKQKEGE